MRRAATMPLESFSVHTSRSAQVGAGASRCLQGIRGIGERRHNLHILLRVDGAGERVPKHRLVLYKHDAIMRAPSHPGLLR
jgi:hypothetical protein